MLATACGLIVANLYYAQPLVGPIARDLALSPQAAGLIVTVTQLGYCAGLLLIVPLGDLVENRRLVLVVTSLGALALVGAGLSSHPLPFLLSGLLVGLGSVAVQILIPYAGHLAPAATRGRAVGNVTSGLMIGVLLARPASGFMAAASSWHMRLFRLRRHHGGADPGVAPGVAAAGADRAPHYGQLLGSMVHLAATNVVLRRRALYHATLFGVFSMFWTAVPLLLAGPPFIFPKTASRCSRWSASQARSRADRRTRRGSGMDRPATAGAILLTAGGFALTKVVDFGSTSSLVMLAVAAITIDFGVQANVVLGFRALFALGGEARSRLNGLYMTTFFLAGAMGSATGGWAYASGGWTLIAAIGMALPLLSLIYLATEPKQAPHA